MKIRSVSFEGIENNKRIQPKGMPGNQTSTHKTGIKAYGKAAGVFLLIFCVATRIKDADGKVWYVNKASLRDWAKANTTEGDKKKFQLRNLDQLLSNMKKPPKSESLAYSKERIGKELWLREGQLVSDKTQVKVNAAASYLQKEGFELVGAKADGNCYFDAFLKSLESSSRKIPLLATQDNPITYLRDLLSDLIKNTKPDRAIEIKKDQEWVSVNEGDLFASQFRIPIRVITPDEEGNIHDFLTFPDKSKAVESWDTVENKPKTGEYLIIVDFGSHFVTARPKS